MDSLRPAAPDYAAACGRVCYDAFGAINDEHRFPRDFPSAEVATGLLCMLIDHLGSMAWSLNAMAKSSVATSSTNEARSSGSGL